MKSKKKSYPEMIRIDKAVSMDSIKDVLMTAKMDAWNETKRLRMSVPIIVADDIQTKFHGNIPENFCDIIEEEDIQQDEAVIEGEIDSDDKDMRLLSDANSHLNFPDLEDNVKFLTPKDSITVVKDEKGKLRYVKKSTLCWYFSNHNKKLSSDRNIRVKKCGANSFRNIYQAEVTETGRQNQIHKKDYCVFEIENSDKCLLRLISGFAYMKEKK